ncbi:hypothetical protein BKA62DRAFT_761105 [Auriculariales sp. MPI-PUGE-AT-0066]|nr:hypothetical protein BKA62DRAFT_761105 [Auriculariales sp. MPI-PUGE-AT-0066]
MTSESYEAWDGVYGWFHVAYKVCSNKGNGAATGGPKGDPLGLGTARVQACYCVTDEFVNGTQACLSQCISQDSNDAIARFKAACDLLSAEAISRLPVIEEQAKASDTKKPPELTPHPARNDDEIDDALEEIRRVAFNAITQYEQQHTIADTRVAQSSAAQCASHLNSSIDMNVDQTENNVSPTLASPQQKASEDTTEPFRYTFNPIDTTLDRRPKRRPVALDMFEDAGRIEVSAPAPAPASSPAPSPSAPLPLYVTSQTERGLHLGSNIPSAPRAMRSHPWLIGSKAHLSDETWLLIFSLVLGDVDARKARFSRLVHCTHVCQSWRSFVLGRAVLWSDLRSLSHNDHRRLSSLLSRSKSCNVRLELDFRDGGADHRNRERLDIVKLVKVVKKHLNRFGGLTICFTKGSAEHAAAYNSLVDMITAANSAPLLTSFKLSFPPSTVGATKNAKLLFARRSLVNLQFFAAHLHLLPDICPEMTRVRFFEALDDEAGSFKTEVTLKLLARVISCFPNLVQLKLPAPLAASEVIHNTAAIRRAPALNLLEVRDAGLRRGQLSLQPTLDLFKLNTSGLCIRLIEPLRESCDFVLRKLVPRIWNIVYVPTSTTTGGLAIAAHSTSTYDDGPSASFLSTTSSSALVRCLLAAHPASAARDLVTLTLSTQMVHDDWQTLLATSLPALTTLSFIVLAPSLSTEGLVDLFSSVTLLGGCGGANSAFRLTVPALRHLAFKTREPLLSVGVMSPFSQYPLSAPEVVRVPLDGVLDLLKGCGCPIGLQAVSLQMHGVWFVGKRFTRAELSLVLDRIGVRIIWVE